MKVITSTEEVVKSSAVRAVDESDVRGEKVHHIGNTNLPLLSC